MPLSRISHYTLFSSCANSRDYRDVNAYSKGNSSIEPLDVFDDHSAVVGVGSASLVLVSVANASTQDVDWHASNENVFASVGDDKMLKM